jgi:class 3 adenylate cyclase
LDIADWLRGLSLERYAETFRDNAIELEVLPEVSEADLEKLGVLLGHRKIMLKAIAALGEPAPQPVAEPTPSRGGAAERRQLTVMFCDLVGSTALSTRHDPEDLRELLRDYHRAVADTVGGFDGFVAKYMGGGC